jgi:arylsulfatase A-like enzyme
VTRSAPPPPPPRSRRPAFLASALCLLLPACDRAPSPPAASPPGPRAERRIDLAALLPTAALLGSPDDVAVKFICRRDDIREAIVMRPPVALRFPDVPLHPGATASFAVAVERPAGGPAPPVTFVVQVETPAGLTEVFRDTVAPDDPRGRGWNEVDAALPRGAGGRGTGTVTLAVSGGDREVYAIWGRPAVVSDGVPDPRDRSHVVRVARHRDLVEAFAEAAVEAAPDGAVPRLLARGNHRREGGRRPAVVPPGAAVRWRLPLDARDALDVRYHVGLEPGAPPAEGEAGFAVLVREAPAGRFPGPWRAVAERRVDLHGLQPGVSWMRTIEDTIPLGLPAAGTWDVEIRGRGDLGGPGTRAAFGRLAVVRREPAARRRRGDGGRNIVLVLVDTLGARHLGAYGYARPTSPAFDRLAARGVLFEDATAPAPSTVPSTASVLTGVFPARHHACAEARRFVAQDYVTLAEAAAEAGYTTAAFVANALLPRGSGFDQGFEEYHEALFANAGQMGLLVEPWIRDHREERFLLYVHYLDPHAPYAAPGSFYGTFGPSPYAGRIDRDMWDHTHRRWTGRLDLAYAEGHPFEVHDELGEALLLLPGPVLWAGGALRDRLVDLYDGEVRFWDDRFGALVRTLISTGLWEETILAVIADHGEALGDNRHLGHGYDLDDSVLHVPFLLSGGPVGPPRRVERPVSLVDVMPILLESAGLPLPPGLDGLPLSAIDDPAAPDRPLFAGALACTSTDRGASRGYQVGVAVRTAWWEGIHLRRDDLWKVRRRGEPFPVERLASSPGPLPADLQAALLEYEARLPDPEAYRRQEQGPSEAERNMLEALGYLR